MESDIIKISHLNKSFGEVKAVNDLSFRVKNGELFAFLGVNGAGKSTTISILCGLLKKDSGTVQVNGIETDKAGSQTKRMLGVVFQDSVLDKPLDNTGTAFGCRYHCQRRIWFYMWSLYADFKFWFRSSEGTALSSEYICHFIDYESYASRSFQGDGEKTLSG